MLNGFLSTTPMLLLVVAAILLFTVARGVRTVPQGYEYTVERFGKYRTTLHPGLGLIIPYVDAIGHKVNMQEQVIAVPEQVAITKDNATVTIDAVLYFTIVDSKASAYQVANLQLAMVNLAQTNIRTVVGSMDLDDTLSNREKINVELLNTIDNATSPWGVKVNRVEIKDLSPPADILQAMGQQLKADREKRAAVLSAEGAKQAAILRAEGQKQATILEAEGKREAAYREAEARERAAQAEARATQMVSEAIANGNAQAINYFIAQRYLDQLGKFATSNNQKLLVLPVEVSGVIGSLAGIVEIAKASLGDPKPKES